MKGDYDSIVRAARLRKINTEKIDLNNEAGRLESDKTIRLHLGDLDEYLSLPSDEQEVTNLTRQMSNLVEAARDLKSLGSSSKIINKIISHYSKAMIDYDKRLKVQGLRFNFLKINDYRKLEEVKKYIYQESSINDQLYFLLDNNHMIENSRPFEYKPEDQRKANIKTSDYLSSIQRLNNYLINELEYISFWQKILSWFFTHFAPTLLSLILIIVIWAILWAFDIKFDLYNLMLRWKP